MRNLLYLVPLAFLVGGCWPGEPEAAQRSYGEPHRLCDIRSTEIDESSGVAPSTKYAGEFYTHNDSGDRARFFRFNERGDITATIVLAGASATDWEDMECAQVAGRGTLYLGDIGDNQARRTSITVYRLPEPSGGPNVIARKSDRIEIRYEDGPHNAEGLIVDPASGDLYIVTKISRTPAAVYRVAAPTGSGSFTARKVGEIPYPTNGAFDPVTGASASPDGRHVVVRTYTRAYEYDVPAKFADWVLATPRPVKLALEVQGEAIGYRADGSALLTTSEGNPCPVTEIRIVK